MNNFKLRNIKEKVLTNLNKVKKDFKKLEQHQRISLRFKMIISNMCTKRVSMKMKKWNFHEILSKLKLLLITIIYQSHDNY
jgi:hypothetical protein